MNKKENKSNDSKSDAGTWIRCKQYTNRWGKLMIATDYGYPYWCFLAIQRRKA